MGLERRGRVKRSHDRGNWEQDFDACDRQAVRLAFLLDGTRLSREVHVRLCDQEMQVWTVGDRPTEVKVRSLVAWIAGRREIEFPKPIDKAIFRMVSKSSGRNESERRCGLESDKPQGLSLQPEGESSMDRRRLTDAAVFTLAG
jgi:hypothetical protein